MKNSSAMRICIPIKHKPFGGMYSFLRTFSKYLQDNGITVTDEIDDEYDVLFANSFMVPYGQIRRAKKRLKNLTVVQRIDGSAQDYGRMDDADMHQARINMLTDLTIFQSKYSKFTTTQKFKVISQDGPVIYNPVNVDIFRSDGERVELPGRINVCHVTFSTNPRKGVASLYEVAGRNQDVDFILVGRYENTPPLKNIHLLGHLDHEALAQVLRSCHVFLTFSENEACPNVVLEALASGLPVLYKNSGGTPELVGECGLPVEVANFRKQLDNMLEQHDELSQAARARAVDHFTPRVIFPQYIESMEQARRRPLPGYMDFSRSALAGYPVYPSPSRVLYRGTRKVIAKAKRILLGNRRD